MSVGSLFVTMAPVVKSLYIVSTTALHILIAPDASVANRNSEKKTVPGPLLVIVCTPSDNVKAVGMT